MIPRSIKCRVGWHAGKHEVHRPYLYLRCSHCGALKWPIYIGHRSEAYKLAKENER